MTSKGGTLASGVPDVFLACVDVASFCRYLLGTEGVTSRFSVCYSSSSCFNWCYLVFATFMCVHKKENCDVPVTVLPPGDGSLQCAGMMLVLVLPQSQLKDSGVHPIGSFCNETDFF